MWKPIQLLLAARLLAQNIPSEACPRATYLKPGPGQPIRSPAQSILIWTRKTTHSHLRAYSQMHLHQELRGGQGTWTCWWEFLSWNMNQTATSRQTTLDCHLCQRLYLHEAEAVSWPLYWEQTSWLCPSWAWLPCVLLCSVRWPLSIAPSWNLFLSANQTQFLFWYTLERVWGRYKPVGCLSVVDNKHILINNYHR